MPGLLFLGVRSFLTEHQHIPQQRVCSSLVGSWHHLCGGEREPPGIHVTIFCNIKKPSSQYIYVYFSASEGFPTSFSISTASGERKRGRRRVSERRSSALKLG